MKETRTSEGKAEKESTGRKRKAGRDKGEGGREGEGGVDHISKRGATPKILRREELKTTINNLVIHIGLEYFHESDFCFHLPFQEVI